MANNNNIYYNAAYTGFLQGALSGRKITSSTSADYLKLTQAAQAYAQKLDSKIAQDALVSTGGGDPSQLAITTNVIAADEQWRAGLLHDLSAGVMNGSYTEDATAADYDALASAVHAAWVEALLLAVTP